MDELIREAFYAGAQAFMSGDKIARKHQASALPEVFDNWLGERAEGASAAPPAVLAKWSCPACEETGEGDPSCAPLFCYKCYSKPGEGKWIECMWEGAEDGEE
jgi:hypothetical protein